MLLLFVGLHGSARGDAATVDVNGMVEVTVLSDVEYSNPHYDVSVTCTFTRPGLTETVEGFWDGGRTYRFRFSPPAPGEWRWSTSCSDTANRGMHGAVGGFTAVVGSSDDPYRTRGWLRVSGDRRHLTYGDGTPFFYLGDTAWEITWKSVLEELRAYISDRKNKEFNVIQIVPCSHQQLRPNGIVSRRNEPFYLDWSFDRINPRYFAYLDTIVSMANDSGLAVAIAPLWAAFTEVHPKLASDSYQLDRRQSLLLAHYVGARYAGSNVIWIVAGDNVYDTDEMREFWGEFAGVLEKASGGRHLATLHPHGWGTSYQYFGNDVDWMHFNMYQSSHETDITFTYEAALQGYALLPTKPLLNGESVYEDIPNVFWRPTPDWDRQRMTARDVRQASYESVLSGALVGITYGAHGIWQWHYDPTVIGSYNPRYTVLEALSFPGSSQMPVMKHIMERYDWSSMAPRQDLVVSSDSGRFIPLAMNDRCLLAYVKRRLAFVRIDLRPLGSSVRYRWIDPRTGEESVSLPALGDPGIYRFATPDTNDWLLVAEPGSVTSSVETPVSVTRNPFRGGTALIVADVPACTATLRLSTVDGRVLLARAQSVERGTARVEIPSLPAGVYVYALIFDRRDRSPEIRHGTLVSLGE